MNESFSGLRDKVDKRIPCGCKSCRTASVPKFFDQKELLQRKEDKRLSVECPRSYEQMDVLELLEGTKVEKLPDWANKAPGTAVPRKIRIFLASSSELREDRDAFELYFRQKNDGHLKRGFYPEIVRWENFLDAMSDTRSQDEYNKDIRTCEIFVCLCFTKCGKFTKEEFAIAHQQFKSSGRPFIYTFFKHAPINTGTAVEEDLKSMWAFQAELRELEHFYTDYDSVEHLKRQFNDQLEKMLEQIWA